MQYSVRQAQAAQCQHHSDLATAALPSWRFRCVVTSYRHRAVAWPVVPREERRAEERGGSEDLRTSGGSQQISDAVHSCQPEQPRSMRCDRRDAFAHCAPPRRGCRWNRSANLMRERLKRSRARRTTKHAPRVKGSLCCVLRDLRFTPCSALSSDDATGNAHAGATSHTNCHRSSSAIADSQRCDHFSALRALQLPFVLLSFPLFLPSSAARFPLLCCFLLSRSRRGPKVLAHGQPMVGSVRARSSLAFDESCASRVYSKTSRCASIQL